MYNLLCIPCLYICQISESSHAWKCVVIPQPCWYQCSFCDQLTWKGLLLEAVGQRFRSYYKVLCIDLFLFTVARAWPRTAAFSNTNHFLWDENRKWLLDCVCYFLQVPIDPSHSDAVFSSELKKAVYNHAGMKTLNSCDVMKI